MCDLLIGLFARLALLGEELPQGFEFRGLEILERRGHGGVDIGTFADALFAEFLDLRECVPRGVRVNRLEPLERVLALHERLFELDIVIPKLGHLVHRLGVRAPAHESVRVAVQRENERIPLGNIVLA